ncbi:hypothetical protein FOFC_07495 [Fusarium oxysporum]|nr:hypothetical protein FOFC_07495 [Fusarium oxysporum]
MPEYTEQDLQSAIVDVRNGVAVRTAATRHGEEHLKRWILRQEALGYAPTHAQVRAIASSVLKQQGDHKPLGRKWSSHFVERHLAVKANLGRRTDWKRINAATPDNIRHLFNLYETVSWIPPRRRYNADEGGIIEGQGINGLVIGSSQENPNAVPVKMINARTWTPIVECISALGLALNPLAIFKAKTKHPGWHVTFSENGWTSNDIAVEWLGKVFLPPTQPENPADGRLLIVDGHGSHTSDEFMTMCYLNNVHLLFFPAHTSHVLQPLDLSCFSSLKTAYRRLVGEHTALTDTTKVGKVNFLEFYAKAREIGLRKENVQSGWKAIGLYPKNEDDLVNYIIQRERAFQPLTRQEIHDFAQALSAVNGDVSYIGKNWVDRFVSRHETIEMKPSRVIDAARKRCVTEEMLTEYYNGLSYVIESKKILRSNSYNIDETGVQLGETNGGTVAGTVMTPSSERKIC